MSELPQVTAAPATVDIGGQAFELSPLGLRDFGQLERQALADYKRAFIKVRADNIDLLPGEVDADKFIREAFAEAQKIDSLPDKEVEVAGEKQKAPYAIWWSDNTFDGRLYVAWLSMRKSKPDMTLDDVDELFMAAGMDALQNAAAMVGELSNASLAGKSNGSPKANGEATAASQNASPGPPSSEASAKPTLA